MKLSLLFTSALASVAVCAPYQRCMMNGKVVSCDKMADSISAYADRYYKAHPEELEKLQKMQQELKV
ncbi:hypothetical protein BDV95DRAFT_623174 [Massariosphaeria phaeospora]|uniref:Uncharacterized protein n=1 Tax=Massariosphaeria phaeospora TaxID=100035 RepID=A0A7C8M324_9PLEO|nr:hypothetical protein BDV95DRAFT_623174 [Massariosphaeria phaeospora]